MLGRSWCKSMSPKYLNLPPFPSNPSLTVLPPSGLYGFPWKLSILVSGFARRF